MSVPERTSLRLCLRVVHGTSVPGLSLPVWSRYSSMVARGELSRAYRYTDRLPVLRIVIFCYRLDQFSVRF